MFSSLSSLTSQATRGLQHETSRVLLPSHITSALRREFSILSHSVRASPYSYPERLSSLTPALASRIGLFSPTITSVRHYGGGPGMGGRMPPRQGQSAGGMTALETYCQDLTQLAKDHKLDPVIGREDELRRTIEVLSRRRKNNPILIGEPGVGKTAILEGLADRIVKGEIPESLKNHRVLSLDFGALLAGASMKGEFEQRMKSVIKEVEAAGDVILFVDEVHLITGGGGGDSVNASNLLKPALARGSMLFCGATTLDEYRMHIEKDGALARRFQTVYIEEPSIDDTISILRGIKEKYELHHKVTITDAAVVAAAKYAKRFFRDRKLPDKAIDLLDEAASRLCMQLESKPDAIHSLERDLMQRKIELAALQRETEETAVARRAVIQESVNRDEKRLARLTRIWDNERARRQEFNQAKEDLEKTRIDLQQALKQGDFAKAGELQHVTIPAKESKVNALKRTMQQQRSAHATKKDEERAKNEDEDAEMEEHTDTEGPNAFSRNRAMSAEMNDDGDMNDEMEADMANQRDQTDEEVSEQFRSVLLAESVGEEDIASVVARHTGIPVNKLLQKDKRKLLMMEKALRKKVVGQDAAISSVAECVRVARAGLQSPNRPHGVFLFLGPSGVGKTELTKALADFLFDDPGAMVRIDMSEYHEKFSTSRLIGSPPGYVGYEEGGVLTEAVRRRPYQIVLFDEIEKAHKEVCNLLLQVFDEGFLTDSQGHKVDFRNTLIIMTSNLGAREAQELAFGDGEAKIVKNVDTVMAKEMTDVMRRAVRSHFPPEFVNRVDEIITFQPLSKSAMRPIAQIQLRQVETLMREKRVGLRYSPKAIDWLAEKGFDPVLGARPMKRTINTYVLQPLARATLSGLLKPRGFVKVYAPGELKIKADGKIQVPEGEIYIGAHHLHSAAESLCFTVVPPPKIKALPAPEGAVDPELHEYDFDQRGSEGDDLIDAEVIRETPKSKR